MSDSDGEPGGDQSRGPDPETLREMRERVEELDDLVGELRALADEAGVPAVERTAKRLAGTLAGIDQHLPPELVDEEQ